MKSMSCTMSRCRLAACILEISLASDRRCCKPASRSSRIRGSLFADRTGLAILHMENLISRLNFNSVSSNGSDLVQDRVNLGLQLLLNGPRRTISIYGLETVDLLHLPELLLNLLLVLDKTVVHVLGPVYIHARLPIVEHRVLPEVAFNKYLRTNSNVEDCIRYKSNAVDLLNPVRLHAADDRARHELVYVPVRQDDKARTQCRQYSVLELICKVGCVEQAERTCPENVALHCGLEFTTNEAGALQTDICRRIAAPFEPVSKQVDL